MPSEHGRALGIEEWPKPSTTRPPVQRSADLGSGQELSCAFTIPPWCFPRIWQAPGLPASSSPPRGPAFGGGGGAPPPPRGPRRLNTPSVPIKSRFKRIEGITVQLRQYQRAGDERRLCLSHSWAESSRRSGSPGTNLGRRGGSPGRRTASSAVLFQQKPGKEGCSTRRRGRAPFPAGLGAM